MALEHRRDGAALGLPVPAHEAGHLVGRQPWWGGRPVQSAPELDELEHVVASVVVPRGEVPVALAHVGAPLRQAARESRFVGGILKLEGEIGHAATSQRISSAPHE